MSDLTPFERDLLDFETHFHFIINGSKQQAMRILFDLTDTRYYQILVGLIERPEALAYQPVTVNRLRALAESGRRKRHAREAAIERAARERGEHLYVA